MHLVLEELLLVLLLLKRRHQLLELALQPRHAHLQVSHDQAQVLEDATEVQLLLLHLVRLLLKLLDGGASGSNIALQLLDLVVKHELELLELLRLLLQVSDALVLVADCGLTLAQLQHLRLDLGLKLVVGRDEFVELGLTVLNVSAQSLLLTLLLLEFALDGGQPGLGVHTLRNNIDELLLVGVFDLVDLVPGLVLDFLALRLVFIRHLGDLSLQVLAVLVLLLLLQVVLNLQLFVLLVLQKMQLRDLLSEALFLLLLLVKKFLVALVIVERFLLVLLLFDLEFFVVQAAEFLNLLLAVLLDLVLLLLDEPVAQIALLLLPRNLLSQLFNLLVILLQVIGDVQSVCVLVHLDVSLELSDFFLQSVALFLLNQDLVADRNGRQLLLVWLLWLFVGDREDAEHTVVTHRKEAVVLEVQLQTVDLLRVSLHFEGLVEVGAEHLNGRGLFSLTAADSHEFALRRHDYLVVSGAFFVATHLLGFPVVLGVFLLSDGLDLADGLVSASRVHARFRALVGFSGLGVVNSYAVEGVVLLLELPDWEAGSARLDRVIATNLIRVQLPEVNV